jgi:hypothetical protein
VLVSYMREAAISAGVPRSSVYDVTLYLLAGLLVIGLVANLLVRPVPHRSFMSERDLAAAQVSVAAVRAGAAARSRAGRGFGVVGALAWGSVGIPILWGVWITVAKVAVLFG